MNNRINDRLKKMAEKKPESRQNITQAEMMAQMTDKKDDTPDFSAIAEELEARKHSEAKGENDGYIKDTIYVEASIYKSFNALCVRRGDKKKFTNEALAQYVEREYKKLKNS